MLMEALRQQAPAALLLLQILAVVVPGAEILVPLVVLERLVQPELLL